MAISAFSLLAEPNKADNYVALDVSAIELEAIDTFLSTEKIEIPKMTPLKPLRMKKGEREADFLIRVRALTKQRQKETFEIQKRYRVEAKQRC